MRSSAQSEDHTARQWVGDVQASADVDSTRSLANGCGLVTMVHDDPFQVDTHHLMMPSPLVGVVAYLVETRIDQTFSGRVRGLTSLICSLVNCP